MKIRIWPYKNGSKGAKNIQRELQNRNFDCLRIMHGGTYRRQFNNHLIINWGNYEQPNFSCNFNNNLFLNSIFAVSNAHNKLSTLNILSDAGVNIPEFTEDKEYAQVLLHDNNIVYCRQSLTSCGGRHIVVAQNVSELVTAPLYTKGVNIRREYRVHVFKNKAIDIVRKSRRIDETGNPQNINMLIRNHTNGWIFCREFEFTRDSRELIETEAIKAVNALGLDFGAVDIVTEKNTGIPYVLEVNTAPGNEGITTHKYVDSIIEYINTL